MNPAGRYWYNGGYNRAAIIALIPAALVPIICVLAPGLETLANFTWFIGVAIGFAVYLAIGPRDSAGST
jgi:NCS1 family nucleobase:cation symporter-1